MKVAEIKLENNKNNWLYMGFVIPESVLSQSVMDLIEGRMDGIKKRGGNGSDSFQ